MHMIETLREAQDNILEDIKIANRTHKTDNSPTSGEDAGYIAHLMKALYYNACVLAMEKAAWDEEAYGARRSRIYRDSMHEPYGRMDYDEEYGARSRDTHGRYRDGESEHEAHLREIMRTTSDDHTREALRKMLDK